MSASRELNTEEREVLTLREYIDKYYDGYQYHFAAARGIATQQVSRWMKKDVFMINGSIYVASTVNKNVDFIEEVN